MSPARMRFPDQRHPLRRFPPISFTASVRVRGDRMLGSGIIDVAIGLAFIFGVTAALSSVFTELIARFLGLRGAYLLGGLRELLDGTGSQTALNDAIGNYNEMKALVKGPVPATGGGINKLPEWMPTLKQSLQTLAANAGK